MIYEYRCFPCPGDDPDLQAGQELCTRDEEALEETGHTFEVSSSIKNRKDVVECPRCKRMSGVRIEIPSSTTLDTKGGFQMGAVLKKTGQVVPGHFGASARKGKWYKP
jgi:hypothetical protein